MLNRGQIERLVSLLGIEAGPNYQEHTQPAKQRVVDALMGQSTTSVEIVDCPYQGKKWVVIGTVPDSTDLPREPLVIEAASHRTGCGCTFCQEQVGPALKRAQLPAERLATTEEVASFFRRRCDGLGEETQDHPRTWTAAATDSFAVVTLGGDLPEVKITTQDAGWQSNHYKWFDLNEIPLGGSVYRISTTPTLWLFTRREEDGWEITLVPSVRWAVTRGGKDFGAMLEGALVALATN